MARTARTERLRAARPAQLAALLLAPAIAVAQAPQSQSAPSGGAPGGPPGASGNGLTPINVGGTSNVQRYTVTPGLRVSATWSDNIELQPNGNRSSGSVLEVVPNVGATVNTPRASGAFYYALRGQFINGATDSTRDARSELRAQGDLRLTEDLLRLYARASVFDVNVSPFGASSFDPGVQTRNRTQYRDVELAPYLTGRVDGEGRWMARYGVRYIDPGSGLQYSMSQVASANVRSDLERRRFGVSARGEYYTTSFERGLDYTGGDTDLLGWWTPSRALRLGLGAGYARNEVLFNSEGRNQGWGPSAALEWTPDARTSVIGRWAERYYGNSAELRARTVSSNWTFGLDYFTGISSGNASGLFAFNTASLFNRGAGSMQQASPMNNTVAQSLVGQSLMTSTGTTLGSGLANSPIVYLDSMVASAGWVSVRSAVLMEAFLNNRRTAVAFAGGPTEDVDQYGGALTYRYRLDPRNAVNVTGRRQYTDSRAVASTATLDSLWMTWDYRITPRALSSLGGRVQTQRGDGLTVRYDEAALFGTLNVSF